MAFPLSGATLTATNGVSVRTPAVPVVRITGTATWSRKLSLWTTQRTVPIHVQPSAVPTLRVAGSRVWQASFGVLRPPTTGQLWPRGDRIVVG